MKVPKINEHIQAYNIAQTKLSKDREIDIRHTAEKKEVLRLQETRTERAKRLDLIKGRNVDVDC